MKKTIIIACGTGIATSTVATGKVKKLCKENDIDCEIKQCKISEVKSYADEADLLVTTTISNRDYDFPVINAQSFLTGINEDQTLNEILEALK
jgi:PTS system galactitol-specific IIB component